MDLVPLRRGVYTFYVGKWVVYFGLVTSLRASSIYWSSVAASPTLLGLDAVTSLNDSGEAAGEMGGQAAEVSVSTPGVVLLGVPFPYSVAVAINNSGQIAGTYLTANGYVYGFFWSASSGMVPLGTLGGDMSIASSMNDAGQVVGQSLDASDNLGAFLWTPGAGMSQIGDPSSEMATAINDTGRIAYEEDPAPYWTSYGAVGGLTSPSVLNFGGQGSTIVAMNDGGWIVGVTSNGRGFLWTPGGVVNFGSAFQPQDINNGGQVLGSYHGQPAVWTESGGFQLLNLGGYSQVFATSINDEGQIVGDSAPVPEPSSLMLCAIGSVLIAAGWRRRAISAMCPWRSRWRATVRETPLEACHSVPPVHPR